MTTPRSFSMATLVAFLLITATLSSAAMDEIAKPPEIIGRAPANEASVVSFPDGSIKLFTIVEGDHCASMTSVDQGRTWSALNEEFKVPAHTDFTARAMLDRDGETHVCFLVGRGVGNRKYGVDLFYDVWHAKTSDKGARWNEPACVFKGYVGAIRGFIQLKNGRLLLPIAEWVGNRPTAPPTGANESLVCYSDDGGYTWKQSTPRLTCPSPKEKSGIGGVEPTVIQLDSGRIWMLIRTQADFLYESFSDDNGGTWTPPQASRFASSESPACLLRLKLGQLLLIWNNCAEAPKVDGKVVYSGRDALHAAISYDEGMTWRGFREIYRDPTRHQSPPKSGDRGTAYPSAAQATDGTIVVTSGQGPEHRSIVRFDPRWLEQDSQSSDFSDGLEQWSAFKGVGAVTHYWRDRIIGPELVVNPIDNTGKMLHLRRVDQEAGDGTTWNVPVGRKGEMQMRLMIPKESAGGRISLNDQFFEPTDDAGETAAMFSLPISSNHQPDKGLMLPADAWHVVTFSWDLENQKCDVRLNGAPALTLPAATATINGICYLRLRSTASAPDPLGFYVGSVQSTVQAPYTLSRKLAAKSAQ